MSLVEGKAVKKSSPNYLTAIISISLVLLNIGILGTAILLSKNLPNSLKENIEFQLELGKDINQKKIDAYAKQLEKEDFTKSLTYISKDEAAEIMKKELGEDFQELLGYNPLFASFNLKLNAKYINIEQIKEIENKILQSGYVKSVVYNGSLIKIINQYSSKIILPLLAFTVLLLLIALFLIDSTIKLSMYSKRFVIRSMKLVGATKWFITKPFLKKAILIGITSALIASTILIALIFPFSQYVLNISLLDDAFSYAILVVSLFSIGVLISVISTKRSVDKYLKLKLDDLY